jgi:hypothetical protein
MEIWKWFGWDGSGAGSLKAAERENVSGAVAGQKKRGNLEWSRYKKVLMQTETECKAGGEGCEEEESGAVCVGWSRLSRLQVRWEGAQSG